MARSAGLGSFASVKNLTPLWHLQKVRGAERICANPGVRSDARQRNKERHLPDPTFCGSASKQVSPIVIHVGDGGIAIGPDEPSRMNHRLAVGSRR